MGQLLAVQDLAKRYGATVALGGVTMGIRAGEVHAILGENGAGKSTLVKILSGVVQPNDGTMLLDGAPHTPASIFAARGAGVSTAFQELSLIPHLSVAENLLLPKVSRGRFWPERRASIMQRAAAILAEWEITDIAPDAMIEDLPLAQRQRIEITRALSHATRLLVLDEPTAALPDTSWLFRQIRRLTERGVAVMYISHRLSEVREICQRATILRNGASIETVDLAGVDDAGIFAMMVGHAPAAPRSETETATGDILLETRDLHVGAIKGLNLTLRAGEIVGVAALEGQGQQDLFQALGGVRKRASGDIIVGGRSAPLGTPGKAQRTAPGIAFVPEERKADGIFDNLTAATNIVMADFASRSTGAFVNARLERNRAAKSAERVALSPRYLGFEVGNLSGGNQQKVLLARALMTGAKILILFDPARGVDVGTKQSIYAMMDDFVANGGTILFYSSELTELVQLSTRCVVLYNGQVSAEVSRADMTEERLLAAAHGPARTPPTPLREAS
ncbi:sugar ABC transporter ATP-binding protein [Oceaniglobus indicus]|uniref:sugar ABC transporter ATP-binding protein n=1 Tax=Oceaniglobus indicus TaxID=2047749 RepID=UPI000C1A532B|nr:sugar ABC transporter ATP-binding protein [Oceaniglobus indicus]